MGRLAMVVLLVTAGVAAAQPTAPTAPTVPVGTRLFEEGRELAKQGRWESACEKFKQSLEVDRAPGTSLNYADCLEHLGQLRKAFQMFDEAARVFDRDKDPRAKFARERADAVLARLGTVVIKIADPTAAGLIVELGRQSIPPLAEITERFEPGEVSITARVPGREPFTASARVLAGATVIIEVPAFAASSTPMPIIGSPPQGGIEGGGRSKGRVRLAMIVGGGGIAVLGLGAFFGLAARGAYDDAAASSECMRSGGKLVCTPAGAAEIEVAGTRADIATGLSVAGGVLLTAAVIVYLTAPRETLTVTPVATASTVGVTLSGRF